MGMSLDAMQDALLGKLEAIFPAPEYRVEDWPDDPENYQFAHSNAAILLIFADRVFDRPQATDGTVQPNEPLYQVAYLSRSLRSKNDRDGIYSLLDEGRAGLAGMDLSVGNLWISRERFIKQLTGGVWLFGQDWKTTDVFD